MIKRRNTRKFLLFFLSFQLDNRKRFIYFAYENYTE